MKKTPQCFLCSRFARAEDVVLLRNKKNGIRRWFHREGTTKACVTKFPGIDNWEQVDSSLGETTDEEMKKMKKTSRTKQHSDYSSKRSQPSA